MNGKQLAELARALHNQSADALEEGDAEQVRREIDTLFAVLEQHQERIQEAIPGVEGILESLRSGLESEFSFQLQLAPALRSRDGLFTDRDHAATVFGIISGDILDRMWRRVVILCEIIGLADGSLTIHEAEEATATFLELALQAAGSVVVTEGGDLDA